MQCLAGCSVMFFVSTSDGDARALVLAPRGAEIGRLMCTEYDDFFVHASRGFYQILASERS